MNIPNIKRKIFHKNISVFKWIFIQRFFKRGIRERTHLTYWQSWISKNAVEKEKMKFVFYETNTPIFPSISNIKFKKKKHAII